MAYAQRIITSNSAGDQEFTFTFPYIKEEHIKVFVNFVEKAQGTGSTEFQVITNTTPKKISLNWIMPAFVKSKVGSFSGARLELRTL